SLAAVVAIVLVIGPPIHAGAPLDVNVKEVRAPASAVRTTIEVKDLVPDRFRKVIDGGGLLHLRLQGELWESRPVWDRLVYPAIVRVIQITRDTVPASPMPMTLDLGNADRVAASGRYYVHVIATLGTLAEREADEVGDAVFG